MSFRSVNEIEKFSFEDCVVRTISQEETGLRLELEALIVRPDNSQNTNYTESYAGPTTAHLQNGRVLRVVKEGYRYLDADDNPVEEVADQELSRQEAEVFLKACQEYYLFCMERVKEENGVFTYAVGIEVPAQEVYDTTPTDTYRLEVCFTRAEFVWQLYLNRVQR